MDCNELPLEPHHLGVSSGASKTIFEPTVRLVQIMKLSCTDSNTISKWTKTRFEKSHVTKEFLPVHPKWLPSLWYIRSKPCTYLASRLALCPNRPKHGSTWSSSPRSTIGCVQNDYWAYGTFGANRAPILHPHLHCLQIDRHEIPHDPCHLGVSSNASKMISEPMLCSVQTVHLSCVKISTILNQTKTSFHLSLIT